MQLVFSKMLVHMYQTTLHHVPEDNNLHTHSCDNLICHRCLFLCYSGGSLYSTDVFRNAYTHTGKNVFTLRSSTSEKSLEAVDYVGMVADTLKMRKNICLCRHFHTLDKKMIAKWVLRVETVSVFVRSVLCPFIFYLPFGCDIKGLLAIHVCALQMPFLLSSWLQTVTIE